MRSTTTPPPSSAGLGGREREGPSTENFVLWHPLLWLKITSVLMSGMFRNWYHEKRAVVHFLNPCLLSLCANLLKSYSTLFKPLANQTGDAGSCHERGNNQHWSTGRTERNYEPNWMNLLTISLSYFLLSKMSNRDFLRLTVHFLFENPF